ncbi:hypothetical protein [Candidatus Binatus sp.]|uniref:hypothetical protein n=1 Tax=Candidatus Binatus sp. TaxID=2811406 RepID=UPI003C5BA0C2
MATLGVTIGNGDGRTEKSGQLIQYRVSCIGIGETTIQKYESLFVQFLQEFWRRHLHDHKVHVLQQEGNFKHRLFPQLWKKD